MFDARSILDILIGGGPGGPPRQGRTTDDPSVFTDMLDQLGDQATPQRHPQGQQAPTVAGQAAPAVARVAVPAAAQAWRTCCAAS